MKKFSMLLLDNNRSKAYLQNILRCGYRPSHAIVMGDSRTQSSSAKTVHTISGISSIFDSGISIFDTLEESCTSYTKVLHLDVNTPEIVSQI
jgi:hypothetical protein